MTDTEDSEVIEIDVKPHRRVIRRQRARATCNCGPRTITAPPPAKLIPKGRLGVSIWREILLAKFDSHQPLSRLLSQWSLMGLDVPMGTVLTGLKHLPPLFEPIYKALCQRNAASAYAQADETRWLVFIDYEGKVSHRFGGRIIGQTPTGRATVRLLHMNDPRRVELREEWSSESDE